MIDCSGKADDFGGDAVDKHAAINARGIHVFQEQFGRAAEFEILIRPDGLVAYVSCPPSNKVAVIDLAQWKVQALIDAGEYADGLAWAGKPSPTRGR